MRRHYVFFARCGCPTGLVERRMGVDSEDHAWEEMYPTRSEERDARKRGVRVELVDHAAYTRDFYAKMTEPCPH